MLKLIVDENIAFAKDAFSKFGEVFLLGGRDISQSVLKDADALIVRSITRVDSELLNNTNVKFVGTATIGTDHIDLQYLQQRGIFFSDAKGCNADSVAEYVFTALLNVAVRKNILLKNKIIGVIGVGNVGSRVVKFAEALGLKVLKNDPPKERAKTGSNYVSLESALRADIVTFHVPLIKGGVDKTFHLLNEKNLSELKENVILINTSRGEVIDNTALLKAVKKKNTNLILDVWEGEPSINIGLLGESLIGTSHIAGYSLEGKVNGTKMMFDALCEFTGERKKWNPALPKIVDSTIKPVDSESFEETLYALFKFVYNIENDDNRMRKMIGMNKEKREKYFDLLRKEYPYRREFCNYTVIAGKQNKQLTGLLKTFRFKVKLNG
ncbi:erythronate-4-phosphate dehydrogenase [bacterium BMS3Abin03]|nr:erythronate-4-phosphate dehydrogenase [bacterium BMS3Abin03]